MSADAIEAITKKLVEQGQLIEAGFVGLRHAAMPANASDVQLREMRMAFFAGAQHLFASLMAVVDEDREPTDADIGRMDAIDRELKAFVNEFQIRHIPAQGNS